jgi:cysteine desulfurase
MQVYLDYNGSAPLAAEVEQYLINRLQEKGPYANPNANHFLGMKCSMAIEKSRKSVAKAFSVKSEHIFFNSGATEAISAIFNHIRHINSKSEKKILVYSDLEHSATINCGEYLSEHDRYEIIKLRVLENGQVDLNHLQEIIKEHNQDIKLVSVMAANNETGVIQPIKEIGTLCNQNSLPFFCDATQILGKYPFCFNDISVDFLCCSGHKIGALTGVGALILKDPQDFIPLIIGGKQEGGIRGGTQNYIGIETIGIAFELIKEKMSYLEGIEKKRNQFEESLKSLFPNTIFFGKEAPRVCNTSYFSIPGISNVDIQLALQMKKIFVTTGSACSDKKDSLSLVLSSMGYSADQIRGAVRLSCAMKETVNCFDYALEVIKEKFHN